MISESVRETFHLSVSVFGLIVAIGRSRRVRSHLVTSRQVAEEVTLWRLNRSIPRVPVLYEPCVAFVLQGTKHGFIADWMFVYGPNSYLVLAAPLPFEVETFGSVEAPMLSLYIRLRHETIAELLPEISPERMPPAVVPQTIESAPSRC